MLVTLPKIFGPNGVWITPCCVGLITLLGITIYSKYLNKKSNGEYRGIFMNKTPSENFWEYTINANLDDVNGLVSIIKSKLGGNKLSDCVCSSLTEFLINIVETNDKLDTIDVILDVNKEYIKIYIKDLGIRRDRDFTFKNKMSFDRTVDYTEVLGLNSNLITIKN